MNDSEYLARRILSLHKQLDAVLLITNGLLQACKSSLEAVHDNYDGPNGGWVGFGTKLGPSLEFEIARAEKCLNG